VLEHEQFRVDHRIDLAVEWGSAWYVAPTSRGFAVVSYPPNGRLSAHFFARDGQLVDTQERFGGRGVAVVSDSSNGVFVATLHADNWDVVHLTPLRQPEHIVHTRIDDLKRAYVREAPTHVCFVVARYGLGPWAWPIERATGRLESARPNGFFSIAIGVALLAIALLVVCARRASAPWRSLEGAVVGGLENSDGDGASFEMTVESKRMRIDATKARFVGDPSSRERVVVPHRSALADATTYREAAPAPIRAELVVGGTLARARELLEMEYRAKLWTPLAFAWMALVAVAIFA
jgi:hypothetical protein